MKHVLTTVLALLFAVAAPAQDDTTDARGRALLNALSDDVETITGGFVQTVTGGDGRVKERASGRFAIARPGRFEWVYVEPYEQRIVADGVNLWLHDIDLEQVSVRAQGSALAGSPAGILGGAGALEAFDYQGAFEDGDTLWVQLAARDEDTDFRVVRIGFDAGSGGLAAMELGDRLSQRTLIEFSGVTTDGPVDAARFEFTPPPGADISGTPAGADGAGGGAGDGDADGEPDRGPVPVVPGLG